MIWKGSLALQSNSLKMPEWIKARLPSRANHYVVGSLWRGGATFLGARRKGSGIRNICLQFCILGCWRLEVTL